MWWRHYPKKRNPEQKSDSLHSIPANLVFQAKCEFLYIPLFIRRKLQRSPQLTIKDGENSSYNALLFCENEVFLDKQRTLL